MYWRGLQCSCIALLVRVLIWLIGSLRLPQVPNANSVQMFISDDWLSRDTPSRKRQFARLRLQKRRLEMLMNERSAEVARYRNYIPGWQGEDGAGAEAIHPDSTLGKRLARMARTRKPSPLNPAPTRAAPVEEQKTEKPAADQTQAPRIKPVAHPRVCLLRDSQSSVEDQDDVVVVGGPRRGTPRSAQSDRLPRSPLPPKER
jgi:hypothetical protein